MYEYILHDIKDNIMKYIEKNKWKKLLEEFYKKTFEQNEPDVNKGIQFENLVESLLRNMFEDDDIIFQSTKVSHDGSKDFWAVDEADALWWAECKNYTENISLTQLAPTLIMAELNNVQYLLFFSYSKLNQNLKRRIGQYAYEHQKVVFIYEDELLEELLFENLSEVMLSTLMINKPLFFPNQNVEILFFNEKNPNQLDKKNFNGYYEIEKLSIGGIYNLNTIIVNNSQPKRVRVSIEETEDLLYFELLASEKDNSCIKQKILDLKPNQLQLYKFTVRLVKYKMKLSLPKLIVEILDCEMHSTPYSQPTVTYDCIWNRKDVFIGKNYEDVIINFTSACINKSQISGFIAYGNGGTGKTRTLEECTAILFKNNYRVLNFIGFDSNSSWKDIVREIAYSAFAISEDLKTDIICNMDNIVTPLIQDKEKEGIVSLLKLLNTSDFSQESVQQYYMILFEKLRKGKYAIVVDNLQSYSSEILYFFKVMIQYLLQCQGETKLILLFSINTTLVFDQKYLNFINDFEKVNFITEHIDGFQTENQAIAFLKTILRLDEYPLNYLTMKKVLSHTSLKPKYIEQIANYLIQKGCIELKDGKGVVVDSIQLEKELKNIPQSFEILFSSTYQLLLEKYLFYEKDFKKALSLLYLFCRLDDYTINLFFINRKAISALTTHNFLVDIGDYSKHIYIFEHDLTEQCFIKTIYPDLMDTALDYLGEFVLNDDISRNEKAPYILYGLYRKTFTANQLIYINKKIPDLNIPNKFLFKFYYYFVNNLIAHKNDYSSDIFIEEILNCSKYVRDHISEVDAEEIFDLAYPPVFEIQLSDRKVIEKQFSFVIHYCENKNRLKEVTQAIQIYNKYTQKLCQLLESNPEIKGKILYAQAYIDNRIFVCGKLEGKPDKYLENLNRSIEVARKYKFMDILFEDYFDASNLYFFKEKDMEKGMCLLEQGFKSFYKMPSDLIRKFKVNYYSKNILYYMIKQEFKAALDKVDEALEYIKNNNDINYHLFFKCRYLKYKVICLILLNEMNSFLDNAFDEYERILQIVNKDDDLERYFLRAKYAFFNKNKENFAVVFEHFYSKVSNAINENSYVRDARMLEDLAIKYRLLFSAETFQAINSRAKLLYRVNEILQMSDENFCQFISTYKSSAPIVDKTGRDGYFV